MTNFMEDTYFFFAGDDDWEENEGCSGFMAGFEGEILPLHLEPRPENWILELILDVRNLCRSSPVGTIELTRLYPRPVARKLKECARRFAALEELEHTIENDLFFTDPLVLETATAVEKYAPELIPFSKSAARSLS